MSEPSKQKWELFAELLEDGIATLHIDARRPDVLVPGHLAREAWLALNYSYRYNIADFDFDDQAVIASLSFGGRPFRCHVPWSAVFAITNESRSAGLIWQEDLPPESRGPQAEHEDDTPLPPVPVPTGKPPKAEARPSLRVLEGEAQTPADPQPPRGHLRRVK